MELDHIVALDAGGIDDESNLQGLCVECHKVKTMVDKGIAERKTIGLDGWPVERMSVEELNAAAIAARYEGVEQSAGKGCDAVGEQSAD